MATKLDALENLDSCLNRALPHEEIFVLLGRDASACQAIRHWCLHRVETGKNKWSDPEIVAAQATAERMWRQRDALREELAALGTVPRA